MPGPLAIEVPSADPPTPLELVIEPAYAVSGILKSRQGQLEYSVNWERYGHSEQPGPHRHLLSLQTPDPGFL